MERLPAQRFRNAVAQFQVHIGTPAFVVDLDLDQAGKVGDVVGRADDLQFLALVAAEGDLGGAAEMDVKVPDGFDVTGYAAFIEVELFREGFLFGEEIVDTDFEHAREHEEIADVRQTLAAFPFGYRLP